MWVFVIRYFHPWQWAMSILPFQQKTNPASVEQSAFVVSVIIVPNDCVCPRTWPDCTWTSRPWCGMGMPCQDRRPSASSLSLCLRASSKFKPWIASQFTVSGSFSIYLYLSAGLDSQISMENCAWKCGACFELEWNYQAEICLITWCSACEVALINQPFFLHSQSKLPKVRPHCSWWLVGRWSSKGTNSVSSTRTFF